MKHIENICNEYFEREGELVDCGICVAQNIRRFEIRFILYQLQPHTSDSLLLRQESVNDNLSLMEFKSGLVRWLLGARLHSPTLDVSAPVHKLVKADLPHLCTYCALFSIKT